MTDTYYPPSEAERGWRAAADREQVRALGLDPDGVEALLVYNLAVPSTPWEPYDRYGACLVIKDGWIVGERYNVPEARTFRQYLASNGKAFTIALFGHLAEASARGEIAHRVDLDSLLYDRRWLPEGHPVSDPRKAEITFRQVFTHSSGILPEELETARDNPALDDFLAYTVGHHPTFAEAAPLYYSPGHPEEYAGDAYSSVAMNHLALVLPHLTGLPAHRVLEDRILGPLGITQADYHISAGWNPPGPGNRWATAGSLRLAPRDYARFAYLLMRGGSWAGRTIVPQTYLDVFRTADIAANILSNARGVLGAQYPSDLFRIAGSGLSMAFMVPSLDLIWLRTSRSPNALWDEVVARSLEILFAALR